jgi:hypothetical protein
MQSCEFQAFNRVTIGHLDCLFQLNLSMRFDLSLQEVHLINAAVHACKK